MTYYGRWPYKYEKATELGAAGVLIIHDTKGAAYGWDVLRASWANESFFDPDRNPRLLFEGWIGGETADRILAAAKLDRKALRDRAETPEFAPVPLGLKATVRQHRVYRTVDGVNVAGIVRAEHPEARSGRSSSRPITIISARTRRSRATRSTTARSTTARPRPPCWPRPAIYAQRPERLKNDLCFVAVTAEEQLVLGSAYFARHLPFPKDAGGRRHQLRDDQRLGRDRGRLRHRGQALRPRRDLPRRRPRSWACATRRSATASSASSTAPTRSRSPGPASPPPGSARGSSPGAPTRASSRGNSRTTGRPSTTR